MQFERAESIQKIVIVARQSDILLVQDIVKEFNISKASDIVCGGDTRCKSVLCGLKLAPLDSLVAIHDGVRPFVSPTLIDKTILCAKKHGACIPGVVPKDTVKAINDNMSVKETPKRSDLRLIQTPQVFLCADILAAYLEAEKTGFDATDDSSVAEVFGLDIFVTDGEYTNIKITTPEDISVAEAILKQINL